MSGKQITIFSKSSHTDININGSFLHTLRHKRAAFIRWNCVDQSEQTLNKELNNFLQMAVKNGFKFEIVEKTVTQK